MSKLIILTGLSFAGKTTLGKAISEKFGYMRVDVDVTKENLYGAGLADDDLTQEQWKNIYDATDHQIEGYLKAGITVVDDSRNFRKSERIHAKAIANTYHAGFVTIYVNTSKEVVQQRWNANRENQTRNHIEDKDFEEILRIFQPPTEDENALVFPYGDDITLWIEKYAIQL